METRDDATETIFAIATPPGSGGVGVIRVSGPGVPMIAQAVLGASPTPRYATLARFLADDGEAIDSGIALYFPAPASFTGEHVLELQGHGGAVVQQRLSARLAKLGARAARPGEFSERAFLNDKLDLAQAEAIADLVASGTEAAAKAALRSLEGVFSERVDVLRASLISLRVFVEAALDFPDEEIDFIAESDVGDRLDETRVALERLQGEAQQGRLLRDGITVAIVGRPNAGKSSLLNALLGADAAIVTEVPGTTRDVLRETISIDGLPVHIADTAGIREASDRVEAEGVRRARKAVADADLALLVLDATEGQRSELPGELPEGLAVLRVWNKIDLAQAPASKGADTVAVSALTGQGLDGLRSAIRRHAGCEAAMAGSFSARGRHIDALRRTGEHLAEAAAHLAGGATPELLAEELRLAHDALGEITGAFLPDDLLGAIFANFCIGK